MKFSRRFTLTMAIVALVLYATKSAKSDELQTPNEQVSEEWTMEIRPAVKLPAVSVEVRPASVDASGAVAFDPAAYSRIYNSIPFNRAEYDVNPNYRHDSTMEILTGNARHQTVVRHDFEHKQPVKRNTSPTRPSRMLTPFSASGLLFGRPFGYGYGLGRWGF